MPAEQKEELQNKLIIHTKINKILYGRLLKLYPGYAKVFLITIEKISIDEQELIHGSFTFSAADFAVMTTGNHSNIVLVDARIRLLAPMKVGDVVIFEVKVSHMTTKKHDVTSMGYINKIKIFEGEFVIVILDYHIFKMNIVEASPS